MPHAKTLVQQVALNQEEVVCVILKETFLFEFSLI
jgi:hypothetical protein